MSEEQISNISKIIKEIDGLNLGQISELIEEIKTKYNIQETAIVQPGNAAQVSEKTEEKAGNVSVKFVEIKEGSNKVQIYSAIRNAIKDLNNKELSVIQVSKLAQKDQVILENIPKDKAESVKKELEEKGAKVEIK